MAFTFVPGVFAAVSDQQGSSSSAGPARILLIGIKLSSGSQAALVPLQIVSDSQADEAFGVGSQLAAMVRYCRAQARGLDITAVAVDEAGGGAAASGTVTFAGTATTAQPMLLQVEDETIQVPVAIGDDATAVAASADTELGAAVYDSLHVTSGAALAVLTLTARSNGPHGNDVNIRVLKAPPGVTATVAAMSGGTTAPDVDAALQALGGVRYHYIVPPDADATNLADLKAFLDDRWTKDKAIDGHAIVGKRDTVSNLATLGNGVDDKHLSIVGDPSVPTSPWAQAATVAAARAGRANPISTIRNDALRAIVAPAPSLRLTPDEKETLLAAGVTVYWYVQDVPRIDRFVTTAETNDLGQPSDVFYDVERKITASAMREERVLLLQPLIGRVLVDDAGATTYNLDVEVIDAEGIRVLILDQYENTWQPRGWVSDVSGFEASLVVQKVNRNRFDWQSEPRVNGHLYQAHGTIEITG